MKAVLLVACLFAITFAYSYSETSIPDWIKNDAKQLHETNALDEKSVMEILVNLSDQKIIKTPHSDLHIYRLPAIGEIDFVHLSGRINEFGKTAHVNLHITSPDGTMETVTSPLLQTGQFSTVYPITWESQRGTYKVETEYAGEIKWVSVFHVTKTNTSYANFPPWLVTAVEWWAEEKISDYELVYSIQHLSDLGLIVIPEKESPKLVVKVTGDQLVRRGTTHNINVLVTDGINPLEGAKVTMVMEDYGEDIIREFEGLTDKNGYFFFSWEIPMSFDDYETLLAFISVSGNGSSQTQIFKFTIYCLPGTVNCDIDGN